MTAMDGRAAGSTHAVDGSCTRMQKYLPDVHVGLYVHISSNLDGYVLGSAGHTPEDIQR